MASTNLKFPSGEEVTREVAAAFENNGMSVVVLKTDQISGENILTQVSAKPSDESLYRNVVDDDTWKMVKGELVKGLHEGEANYVDVPTEIAVTEDPSRDLFLRPANYDSLVANYEKYMANKNALVEEVTEAPVSEPIVEDAPAIESVVEETAIQTEESISEMPFSQPENVDIAPATEVANEQSEIIPDFNISSGISETPEAPVVEEAPAEPVVETESIFNTTPDLSVGAPIVEEPVVENIEPVITATPIVEEVPVAESTASENDTYSQRFNDLMSRVMDRSNQFDLEAKALKEKYETDMNSLQQEGQQILNEVRETQKNINARDAISMQTFENSQKLEQDQEVVLTRAA